MQMKHKRSKPAKTKEQEAAEEGWILMFLSKTIRGWNSICVEEARGGQEADEGITRHPYAPSPIVYGPPGSIERCSDSEIERG